MTSEERYICNQQKELYEYAQAQNVDVCDFSNRFMSSDFCNNSIDKPYSVDQFADIVNWVEFLQKDCPIMSTLINKSPISTETAGWIGFTYRHLHFITGLSSKQLAIMVPVNKLMNAYLGLHTIDEDMAIDIIIEDFNLGDLL